MERPSAVVVTLLVAAFVGCVGFVLAAGLPGRTGVLLGQTERRIAESPRTTWLFYGAWLALNVMAALWLWITLFPSAPPQTVIAYQDSVVVAPSCGSGATVDTRCILRRLYSQDLTSADKAAKAILGAMESESDRGPGREERVSEDAIVYATLRSRPISDVVLIGDATELPETRDELAERGWRWTQRWLDAREERGVRILMEVHRVETSNVCADRAARAAPIPGSIRLHLCRLPRPARGIESIVGVRVDGDDLVVDVSGTSLPNKLHARIGTDQWEPTIVFSSRRNVARVRLKHAAKYATQPGWLRVGAQPEALNRSFQLPLAQGARWCLSSPGRTLPSIAAALKAAAGVDPGSEWAVAISRFEPTATWCDGAGNIMVAQNGVVLLGRGLTVPDAQDLGRRLAPATANGPIGYRVRVLHPAFDTGPGLLGDVRLGRLALTTDAVLADPLVVREASFTDEHGQKQAGPGYYDFRPGTLASRTTPLAPIIAWVERNDAGANARRALAASFGNTLWDADAHKSANAWAALAAMTQVHDGPRTIRPLPESGVGSDALGVAIDRVVVGSRQRDAFLALAAWLLLMFVRRWRGT